MSHNLFTPVILPTPDQNGLEVSNRAFVAPMCQYAVDATDGVPTDWHLSHLGALAAGGFGVVVAEATGVEARGRISPQDLGLWEDGQVTAHARLVEFIHGQGRTAGVQLAHAGGKASTWPMLPGFSDATVPVAEGGWQTVSAVDGPVMPNLDPAVGLTEEGIAEVVASFVDAARRADGAGYDVVQIHAAHGYLINQFLSPNDNKRTDEYGGDLESRMRLLVEIYEAIRDEVGAEFPISVKLNSSDGVSGGFDEDESLVVAEKLSELGVDVIEVSGGTYAAPLMQGEKVDASGDTGEIYFGDYAKQLRDKVSTPVLLTGGFRCAADIERGLDGLADLIGMARPLVMVPEYPNELIKQGSRKLVRLPRLSTGSKKLDEPLEHLLGTNWYEMQMDRITDGRAIGGDGLATLWFTLKNHGLTGLLSSRR